MALTTVQQGLIGTPVASTGPAFSAYASGTQSIPASAVTKITFNSELFDTNNNFASSRFTPTVPGYYQVQTQIQFTTGAAGAYRLYGWIYKNGSSDSFYEANPVGSLYCSLLISNVIYMNGTTDYLEVFAVQTSLTTLSTASGPQYVYFSGSLVRAA